MVLKEAWVFKALVERVAVMELEDHPVKPAHQDLTEIQERKAGGEIPVQEVLPVSADNQDVLEPLDPQEVTVSREKLVQLEALDTTENPELKERTEFPESLAQRVLLAAMANVAHLELRDQ